MELLALSLLNLSSWPCTVAELHMTRCIASDVVNRTRQTLVEEIYVVLTADLLGLTTVASYWRAPPSGYDQPLFWKTSATAHIVPFSITDKAFCCAISRPQSPYTSLWRTPRLPAADLRQV